MPFYVEVVKYPKERFPGDNCLKIRGCPSRTLTSFGEFIRKSGKLRTPRVNRRYRYHNLPPGYPDRFTVVSIDDSFFGEGGTLPQNWYETLTKEAMEKAELIFSGRLKHGTKQR